MITTETPDKLAEIIRDTWPQIYRPFKKDKNNHSLTPPLKNDTINIKNH